MSGILIAAMPGEAAPARRLAHLLEVDAIDIEVHQFPDGESRVRAPTAHATTALYCSLNDPNRKLIDLALAASALRDLGARRLVLVAPYLCYMRQDAAFQEGEAVSQRVVGKFVAERFERIITIEPHLHRIRSLSEVFIGAEAIALAAASLVSALIRCDGDTANALIVGPDAESRPWTEMVAAQVGAPFVILSKTRRGDHDVSIVGGAPSLIKGRRVYLVDDVVSTGMTLIHAAATLRAAGAASVEGIIVHALCDDNDLGRLREAGINRIRSTDSVAHLTNAIEIAPLLATAFATERAL